MAYSDGEKAEAMIKLWTSKYNWQDTSDELGIPVRTLRRWDKSVPKNIPDLLERTIQRMLMVIPTDMNAHSWGVALGILFDKWFLAQGEPTSRIERIEHQLGQLSDDEYSRVVEEAEAIIAQASRGD